jgi:GT2 family glycosyltransferase
MLNLISSMLDKAPTQATSLPRRSAATITFLILTYRRPAALLRLLESLATEMDETCAAVVAFNGSEPENRALIGAIEADFPWARCVEFDRLSRGAGRNRAVREVADGIVYYIDDDAIVPPGFVGAVRSAFARHPKAAFIGGPNLAPPQSGALERAIDFVLTSSLGAGPMRIRYLREGSERPRPAWCFTACNVGVRREALDEDRINYPEDCVSAEENLFLRRLEARHGRGVYVPELFVYHARRNRLASFCQQSFQSGLGRAQVARLDVSTLEPVVLLPAAFWLYLAIVGLSGLGTRALIPGFLYAAACLAEAARRALSTRELAAALRVPILMPLAHLSYAAGSCKGWLSPARREPRC